MTGRLNDLPSHDRLKEDYKLNVLINYIRNSLRTVVINCVSQHSTLILLNGSCNWGMCGPGCGGCIETLLLL